ncbi:RTX toxin protein [Enhygromyxa salina]|uniref:RTX toxin protein n=1 Tax=Enhygromyxa salina TaxID=215803 RepID=A0A0C2D7A0_9BACT|nr:FG-GAP-like repeat-containing protein [Enhygromyxa salina]KIG15907.1 RTX toxin protein [Enhygromyxa salina]
MITTIATTLIFSSLPNIPAYDAEGYAIGKEGDRFGFQISSGDLDGDGDLDLVVTAPQQAHGNRVYVFYGPIDLANAPVLEAGMADVTIEGPAAAETGWSVAVGDLGGDGVDDLIVASPSLSNGRGQVHVFDGPLPQQSTLGIGSADHTITGGASNDYLGWSLSVGDYDGDGIAELGAGACDVGAGLYEGIGEAYVFDFDGVQSPTSVTDATAIFKGTGRSGCSLGTADFNGDDFDELLIGSYGDAINGGRNWGGSVAIVYGRAQFDAVYSLRDGDYEDQDIALIVAEAVGNNFGFDIASDDLNLDGYEDLIVGAPARECQAACSNWDRRGRTYVVLGGKDQGIGADRILAGISRASDVADTIYESSTITDQLGRSVAAGGFAGELYNRINHPILAQGVYGPAILIGSGNNEAWALAYDAGVWLELPAQFDCWWDDDLGSFTCAMQEDPKDPRQRRVDVGALGIGGHRFYGDVGQAFGLEVHAGDFDGDGGSDFVFGATHQLEYESPAGDGEAFIFQGH